MKLKMTAACLAAALLLLVPGKAQAAGSLAPESQPLAAGYFHSGIIKEDSSLWMAGENTYGQLGTENLPQAGEGDVSQASSEADASSEDETSSDAENTDGESWSTTYVQVMENVRAVYAGYRSTLAIDNSGVLYGWGLNQGYQLGVGDTENRTTPVQILNRVVTAATGWYNSAAVTEDGTLWVWGWNDFGQLGLGDGGSDNMESPKEVLSGVRSVALGMQHIMAVKQDNTLWASGSNDYGQLADGTTESANTFRQVMDHVESVACTPFGTLILKTDGTLWSCGYNHDGEMGDGTYADVTVPVQVMQGVSAIDCGRNFSAALTDNGELYAWGSNDYGQYGAEMSAYPKKIAEGVTDLSLGGGHLLYLQEDGTVHALGNNEKGQIGNDTVENVNVPEQVAENVAPVPKPSALNRIPLVPITVGAIIVLVVGLFAFLIVRTLRGKKPQPVKPAQNAPGQKAEEALPKLSDRELLKLTREMEESQKEVPDVEDHPDEIEKDAEE